MSSIKQFESICIKSVPLVKIYSAKKDGYPMNNKGRSHHGLLFPLVGAEKYYFRDGEVSASPNTVLFIPKGEKYRIELDDEESVVVCIDIELADNVELRPMHFKSEKIAALRPVFCEADSVYKKNTPWRDASVKSLVYQIISGLISAEAPHSPSQKKLAPALSYLHAHYTDSEFSVELLANKAGVSRRYFEKLFFAEKGMTPRDYVIELKMSLARELLLNEKLSVSDVAAELGYADVYHFSKIFKQKTGKAPGEYKRDHTVS